MGERVFTKFQYGAEGTSAHGTAVAATRILLADPRPMTPDRKPRFIEDAIGVRAKSMRTAVDQYLVADTMTLSNAYFQALPAIFGCGLKGRITPSHGGAGDYTWAFTPSLTAGNVQDSLTLEEGDDTQAYRVEYVQFDRIKVSGDIAQDAEGSPVVVEAGFYGRQRTGTAGFTAGLTLPTPETINAKLARMYLDTTWGSVGTTEKTGLLRAFEVEILTGLHPKFHGGAYRYFDTHAEGAFEVMASFTFEGNSDADAIWDAFNSQSLAVVRLSITGAQIGTGGFHNLTLDVGGKWEEVTPIGEEANGNNLHTAVLHGIYDATGAKLLQASVITNQSTY